MDDFTHVLIEMQWQKKTTTTHDIPRYPDHQIFYRSPDLLTLNKVKNGVSSLLLLSLFLTEAPKHDCVVFVASWLAANINLSLQLASLFIIQQRCYLVFYIVGCQWRVAPPCTNKSISFVLMTTVTCMSDWLFSPRIQHSPLLVLSVLFIFNWGAPVR